MKTTFRLSLFAMALGLPTTAAAWTPPPIKIDAGINARFNVYILDGRHRPRAPWYTYWPMEAHFQRPAPVGGFYPHWPGQWPPPAKKKGDQKDGKKPNPLDTPTLPGGFGPGNPNAQQTPRPPHGQQPLAPPGPFSAYNPYAYRPVSQYQQAPDYWYGR